MKKDLVGIISHLLNDTCDKWRAHGLTVLCVQFRSVESQPSSIERKKKTDEVILAEERETKKRKQSILTRSIFMCFIVSSYYLQSKHLYNVFICKQ